MKLCRMRRGPKGDYYNHQTWEKGKNTVRYVPRDQVASLKHAIAGYQNFSGSPKFTPMKSSAAPAKPAKTTPKPMFISI